MATRRAIGGWLGLFGVVVGLVALASCAGPAQPPTPTPRPTTDNFAVLATQAAQQTATFVAARTATMSVQRTAGAVEGASAAATAAAPLTQVAERIEAAEAARLGGNALFSLQLAQEALTIAPARSFAQGTAQRYYDQAQINAGPARATATQLALEQQGAPR